MKIWYQSYANAWDGFGNELRRLIETYSLRGVCDVGGGANPSLPLEYIQQQGIEYTLLDRSAEELKKAPPGYAKVCVDICDPAAVGYGPFDLIFSKMVLEHIKDAKALHTNVCQMLSPKGVAFHYFPTLYALPFLANKIIPERLSSFLLNIFAPRDPDRLQKFPALYHWTYGPTRAQINRLTHMGYEIIEYRGFFGHIYFKKISGIRHIHQRFAQFLVKHPNPYLTSFAYLIMQKNPTVSPQER